MQKRNRKFGVINEDFVDKALALETVAIDASGSLIDQGGLKDVINSLGEKHASPVIACTVIK